MPKFIFYRFLGNCRRRRPPKAPGAIAAGFKWLLKHQGDILLCLKTIDVSQAASNALEQSFIEIRAFYRVSAWVWGTHLLAVTNPSTPPPDVT